MVYCNGYIEFCKSTFPFNMTLDGMRIVLDCAHGATYQVGPSVFTELGATIIKVAKTGLSTAIWVSFTAVS